MKNSVVILFSLLPVLFSFAQEINHKALFVMDVQENLVNPKSKLHIDTNRIDLFIENMNHVIEKCGSQKIPVFYMVNEWTNPFVNYFTGNVCRKNSAGTGLDKRLKIVSGKKFAKSESNAFSNIELENKLIELGINEIYLVGLMAEGCVKATAKSAFKKNFKVTIITDAIASANEKRKIKALNYYKKKKMNLVISSQI